MKGLLHVAVALIVAALLLPNGALAQKEPVPVKEELAKVPYEMPSVSAKIVYEDVKDFDLWLSAYTAKEADRVKEGMIKAEILKAEDDSKTVTVIQVWPSKTKYEEFEAKLDPEWVKKYEMAKKMVTWYKNVTVTKGP